MDATTIVNALRDPDSHQVHPVVVNYENQDLLDVSRADEARAVGITLPTMVTRAVWDQLIEWSAEDTRVQQCKQDCSTRLRNVLAMASFPIRIAKKRGRSLCHVGLNAIKRDHWGREPQLVRLSIAIGPGPGQRRVVRIMLADEFSVIEAARP